MAKLSTQEKGLSIANPLNIYFGCAATGMNTRPGNRGPPGRRGSSSSASGKSNEWKRKSSCTSLPRTSSGASAAPGL